LTFLKEEGGHRGGEETCQPPPPHMIRKKTPLQAKTPENTPATASKIRQNHSSTLIYNTAQHTGCQLLYIFCTSFMLFLWAKYTVGEYCERKP